MTMFSVGDLVRLRSGGPLMVVAATDALGRWIRCMWFDMGSRLHRVRLTVRSVTLSAQDEVNNPWLSWRQGAQAKLGCAHDLWTTPGPETELHIWEQEGVADWEPDEDDEPEDEDDAYSIDDAIAFEDYLDEMDIESESYARCHEEGWFYGDEIDDTLCTEEDDEGSEEDERE